MRVQSCDGYHKYYLKEANDLITFEIKVKTGNIVKYPIADGAIVNSGRFMDL